MHKPATTIFCVCILVSVSCKWLHQKEYYLNLEKAVSIEICRLSREQPFEDRQIYKTTESIPAGIFDLTDILNEMDKAKSIKDFPMIGHLAHLAFIDGDGNAIAMVSIILHDSTVAIYPCHNLGEDYAVLFMDAARSAKYLQMVRFVKIVFDYLNASHSESLETLRTRYGKYGLNIEEMLFSNKTDRKNLESGTNGRCGAPRSAVGLMPD